MENTRQTIKRGIKDMLPLCVPTVPFAFAVAVAIMDAGFPTFLGWGSSPIVFGGASQLTLISLLGDGALMAAALTAALIVNARHFMYSAAIAPTFQQQPRWFRWFGPFLLVDQVFALAMLRINDPPELFRAYYLTVGVTMYCLWVTFTGLGLLLGPVIPVNWGLGFAVPIMFLGLLLMGINRWPKAVAAGVAALVAYLCAGLPHRSGLLVGALCGVLTGLLLETSKK